MPRRHRPGDWSILYAELPPALMDWLKARAAANHRSVTAEVTNVLETLKKREKKELGNSSKMS